jgi:hypothetical protein
MKRASGIAAACAAALVLTGASAMQANAYYLGYGNGDPGNWDFWTEQHPNSSQTGYQSTAPAPVQHHMASDMGCGALHQRAVQTGSAHAWHRYHACLKG